MTPRKARPSARERREMCDHRQVAVLRRNEAHGVEKGRCQICGSVVYRFADKEEQR